MLGGHGQIKAFQFTSQTSTATIAHVCLGFVPDIVEVFQNVTGTNPNRRYWVNRANFSLWAAADGTSILDTGSTGVLTLETSSLTIYAGGDLVAAADVTNKLYFDSQGNVLAAGQITPAGFIIPVASQTAGGVNVGWAFRDSA